MKNGIETEQKDVGKLPSAVVCAYLESKKDFGKLYNFMFNDPIIEKEIYASYILIRNESNIEADDLAFFLMGVTKRFDENPAVKNILLYSNTKDNIMNRLKKELDPYFNVRLVVDVENTSGGIQS